jgi:hypothetical protein
MSAVKIGLLLCLVVSASLGDTLLSQNFDGTWRTNNPPTGWRIFHNGGAPMGWGDWDKDSLRAPWTTHPTPFAGIHPRDTMDATPDTLISPVIDCGAYGPVTLRCSTNFTNAGPDTYVAQIRYSTDNGVTYPYLARDYCGESTGTICESLVLDQAAGQHAVRICWAFNGDLHCIDNWYVDDVTVVSELVGVAERDVDIGATSSRLPTTAILSLPNGTIAFNAMGRRVLSPKPGVYFLRTAINAPPRKVLLVK